jgi:hypothetical protein
MAVVRKVDLKKELRSLLLEGEARDVTEEHSFDELANRHLGRRTVSQERGGTFDLRPPHKGKGE